jgi:hypothetical protein
MNKEFIPYEQALELKELGFDESCFGKYDVYGVFDHKLFYHNHDVETEYVGCTAPLYQQAFRWFRYKYNLIGLVEGGYDNGKNIFTYVIWNDFKDSIVDDYYQTYEEAELECLKKLIEIVK